ncbi:MAG: gliding motility-associated C-terminal domain-containing protein [Schleiferiaceae bacterium]|nr:gliding motility-associated C-terminal domain-containing protein [Schleiferiaceae bacterium]
MLVRFQIFALLMLLSAQIKGQSDTYFVLPPLYEWEAGDHDIFLYISTNASNASVWIYNSDTSFSQNISVNSGSVGTVSLTTPVAGLSSTYGARELSWSNSKRYKDALFIESSAPITVTEQIVEPFNQDIITAKGRNALGTEFYVASQTLITTTVNGAFLGYHGMHYISVVATEDDTQVKFKAPTGSIFDNGADSVVFTLDKGQSWVSTMEDNDVLLGTHVTSTKPIAVTAGGNHLKNSSANHGDAGIDQVTPVEHLGTKHVVLRGLANYPNDYILYIATKNGTTISVDGVSILNNADAGRAGTFSMQGNSNQPGKPFVIESNYPIYIFQVTTGTITHEPEQGMAQIPQVECTGSTFIRYNRASGLSTAALVTIPTDAVNDLKYNGTNVSQNLNIAVQQSSYDASWSGVYIPSSILTNNFSLECATAFHVGILAGQGNTTGLFGYISGFDDNLKLLDPTSASSVSVIDLGDQCGDSIPLLFSFTSCTDSIAVTAATILQGEGIIADPNVSDSILYVLPDENYSGPMEIQIIVSDNQGATDSLTFSLNYLGADYDPITVPNFITPNADFINDQWSIVTSESLDAFNLDLYNRWGTLIYSTDLSSFEWNGRTQEGAVAAPGVYFYSIQTQFRCGTLYKGGALHLIH